MLRWGQDSRLIHNIDQNITGATHSKVVTIWTGARTRKVTRLERQGFWLIFNRKVCKHARTCPFLDQPSAFHLCARGFTRHLFQDAGESHLGFLRSTFPVQLTIVDFSVIMPCCCGLAACGLADFLLVDFCLSTTFRLTHRRDFSGSFEVRTA